MDKISSWWLPRPTPAPIETKPYNPADPAQNPLNPKGLKPCCACPDTKSARDACFLKEGDKADEGCRELVTKHIECMNALGFRL